MSLHPLTIWVKHFNFRTTHGIYFLLNLFRNLSKCYVSYSGIHLWLIVIEIYKMTDSSKRTVAVTSLMDLSSLAIILRTDDSLFFVVCASCCRDIASIWKLLTNCNRNNAHITGTVMKCVYVQPPGRFLGLKLSLCTLQRYNYMAKEIISKEH